MPQRHEGTKKSYEKLSDSEEEIGKIIINAAYRVHSKLGPGLLEKIYEICFYYELNKIRFRSKKTGSHINKL